MNARHVQKHGQSSSTLWPVILVLSTNPKKMKSVCPPGIYIPCSLPYSVWQPNNGIILGVNVDEWNMKSWVTHGVLFIQKSKILVFLATWTKLENVILHEISQAQKEKFHVPHWCEVSSIDVMETVHRLVFDRHWKGWERMIREDD